ncbi:MAG: hypothetical protein EA381_18010 [Planctomycetaceae bacterium]|nr:MAG: hypothetical protein EA381_18010 [Planctomycetaceae bacterium]
MDDPARSVRVTTGARLHFGLFDTRSPFGGVGMMTDQPETRVIVSAADRFDPGDQDAERLTRIARRVVAFADGRLAPDAADVDDMAETAVGKLAESTDGLPACRIRVEAAAPAHRGFGSGTQLSLAASLALCRWLGLWPARRELVSEIAQRGRRSAIGSIGFFQGGVLFEDGCVDDFGELTPVRRVEPPRDWRVVLIQPSAAGELISGASETEAFAGLDKAPAGVRADLQRRGAGLLDACQNGDFDRFASELTLFNRLSGGLFTKQQGGPYHGRQVADLIDLVRRSGGSGYGQSSWGPTVFAVCVSDAAAQELSQRLRASEPSVVVRTVRPAVRGVRLED